VISALRSLDKLGMKASPLGMKVGPLGMKVGLRETKS
jgi:hypothetical protein